MILRFILLCSVFNIVDNIGKVGGGGMLSVYVGIFICFI